MVDINDNSNYYETLSPTGRNIQGFTPIKRYYTMQQPFQQPINTTVLSIPILFRQNIKDYNNQYVYIDIVRTGGGLLQPFVRNNSKYDLNYMAIVEQQFNNTIQQKNYLQRDSNYTKVSSNTTASQSFIKLQSFGTSTDPSNGGNDRGAFNLNITINNRNFNVIGHWYTPLVKNLNSTNNDALNGWLSIETIDDFINDL